jgi:hypothetical protein
MSTTYDEVHREAVHDAYAHNFEEPQRHLLPSDQVLELWYEEHYHDRQCGAFDETPDDGEAA